jgi:hypothetical protein
MFPFGRRNRNSGQGISTWLSDPDPLEVTEGILPFPGNPPKPRDAFGTAPFMLCVAMQLLARSTFRFGTYRSWSASRSSIRSAATRFNSGITCEYVFMVKAICE